MKQQSGFTLIELIMVIVILGILAATAMPKFSDLVSEARVGKLAAMKASMQSAALMAHGLQLARAVASNVSVSVDGGTAITMRNGWPDDTTAGILTAVNMADYVDYFASSSGVAVDAAHPLCNVSYVNAAAAGPVYTMHSDPADCD
ncbi:MAG: type II secretion system protein [Gallionella sp.]|nr:type II secretion system protein [Gallionella sp.]